MTSLLNKTMLGNVLNRINKIGLYVEVARDAEGERSRAVCGLHGAPCVFSIARRLCALHSTQHGMVLQ